MPTTASVWCPTLYQKKVHWVVKWLCFIFEQRQLQHVADDMVTSSVWHLVEQLSLCSTYNECVVLWLGHVASTKSGVLSDPAQGGRILVKRDASLLMHPRLSWSCIAYVATSGYRMASLLLRKQYIDCYGCDYASSRLYVHLFSYFVKIAVDISYHVRASFGSAMLCIHTGSKLSIQPDMLSTAS